MAIGAGRPLPVEVAAALGWQSGVPVDLGALQTSAQVSNVPVQLLVNGGFERAGGKAAFPANWKRQGISTGDQRVMDPVNGPPKAFSGKAAYQFSGTGGPTALLSQIIKLPPSGLPPTGQLTVSAMVKGKDAGNGGKLRAIIEYADGGPNTTLVVTLPTGSYPYGAVVSAPTPLRAHAIRMTLQLSHRGGKGRIWVDDVALTLSDGPAAAEINWLSLPSAPHAP